MLDLVGVLYDKVRHLISTNITSEIHHNIKQSMSHPPHGMNHTQIKTAPLSSHKA